jgi:hypothetical protein
MNIMRRIKDIKAEAIRIYHSNTVTVIAVAFIGMTALLVLLTGFLDYRAWKKRDVIKIENKYAEWRASGCPIGLELKQYLKDDKQYEEATNVFIIDNNEYYPFVVFLGESGYPIRSLYLTTNGVILHKSENSAASIVSVITTDEHGDYSMTWK